MLRCAASACSGILGPQPGRYPSSRPLGYVRGVSIPSEGVVGRPPSLLTQISIWIRPYSVEFVPYLAAIHRQAHIDATRPRLPTGHLLPWWPKIYKQKHCNNLTN